MKKLIALFLALLLAVALPVTALAVSFDDDDITKLEELAASATDAAQEAEDALKEIIDADNPDDLTDKAQSALDAMNEALDSAATSTDALEVALEDAEAALDELEALKRSATPSDKEDAASETHAAISDVVDNFNDAVGSITDAIESANEVVDAANDAVDAASTAVESAQNAMDAAKEANMLYLGLLNQAVTDDEASFEAIAIAEVAVTNAWNAYVDEQNNALAKVQEAVEKAEEAQKLAVTLYDAWRTASDNMSLVVDGTVFEDLQSLRDAAMIAAAAARNSAIDAVLAANALQDMANEAIDAFSEGGLGSDIIEDLETYSVEIETMIASASDAAAGLVKKITVLTLPSEDDIKLVTSSTRNRQEVELIYFNDNDLVILLKAGNIKTFTWLLENGDTVTFKLKNGNNGYKEWYVDGNANKSTYVKGLIEGNHGGEILVSYKKNGETMYLLLDYKYSKDSGKLTIKDFDKTSAQKCKQNDFTPAPYDFELERTEGLELTATLTDLNKAIATASESDGLFELFRSEWEWDIPVVVVEEIQNEVFYYYPTMFPVAPPAPVYAPIPYGPIAPPVQEVPYGMVKTGQGIEQQAMALGLGFVLISMGILIMKRPRKKNEEL